MAKAGRSPKVNMTSNLDRYKTDLKRLVLQGQGLLYALQCAHVPNFEQAVRKLHGEKTASFLKTLPNFDQEYQSWYSEAKAVIRQLLPERSADFARHYEKPKPRKEVTAESYRIEDALQGIAVTRNFGQEKVVGPDSAIPHVVQQVAILKSVENRFESSLFDIRQLVQADLFDSELDVAKELAKKRFTRAAGAVAGVVLERHLGQVCQNHQLKVTKKSPTIADLNEALKSADVLDIPGWRFIQHLADLRNLCDHSKAVDPTPEQVEDLIAGVTKTIKTLF
jgi:hypothetical protein